MSEQSTDSLISEIGQKRLAERRRARPTSQLKTETAAMIENLAFLKMMADLTKERDSLRNQVLRLDTPDDDSNDEEYRKESRKLLREANRKQSAIDYINIWIANNK